MYRFYTNSIPKYVSMLMYLWGLEHLWIRAAPRSPEAIPHGYQGAVCRQGIRNPVHVTKEARKLWKWGKTSCSTPSWRIHVERLQTNHTTEHGASKTKYLPSPWLKDEERGAPSARLWCGWGEAVTWRANFWGPKGLMLVASPLSSFLGMGSAVALGNSVEKRAQKSEKSELAFNCGYFRHLRSIHLYPFSVSL